MPEQPQDAGAPVIEAEGGSVKVQGVEVDAADSIPTGIPLPDGSTFMVVQPGELVHDPEIDPGREPEEYAADHPKMKEMVASMKAFAAGNKLGIGNDTPVLCRRNDAGQLLIVAGRRRHAAAGYAGTKLAIVVRAMTTKQARVSATVENGQREGASVLGEARQYRDLREKDGMKVEEIAAAVGKQQAYVSKRLALLTLPDWVQAMLRTGELTEGTAYEGMARYVKVPEPAASEMWAVLHRRWDEIKSQGATAERIRNTLGQIARNLSRSMDPATSYPGEDAPLFDLAAHDAACTCKRPKIRLHDTIKEHARCYNVHVWDELQGTARAERRKGLQNGNGNGNGHVHDEDNAPQQPIPAPVKARPTVTPAAYTVPAWSDVTATYGPKADEYKLSDDRLPAELHSANPVKVLDVSHLSADVVQWVQAPYGGRFRLICTDAPALDRAVKGGAKILRERTERMRQQEQAAFREAAAAVDYRSAEVMAALIFNYGEAPRTFATDTGSLLGIDLAGKNLDEYAKLPKKDLTLLLQAIAVRAQKGETYLRDTVPERVREQVQAECAEDFRALLASVPVPEMTKAGILLDRAARVDAGRQGAEALIQWYDDTEPVARADELSEYARAWAEMVNDFRTEANGLAADAQAFGIELDAIANPHGDGSLADLIAAAAVTLQHPTLALIAAEAERQGEQPVDGGEGASAPAPEGGQGEQPVDGGEGASAPAPEAEQGEQPVDSGEGASAPAPRPRRASSRWTAGRALRRPPRAAPAAATRSAGGRSEEGNAQDERGCRRRA
jgi:ParB/RepB/Spo0J family partition protein